MPSVSEDVKVLNGRGSIIQYSSGKSVGKFAYREWNREIRSYKVKHLHEAKTLEEAIAMAANAAISLREVKADKPIAQSFDPLNLIEREEQLIRKKERLSREEKKKEYPKINHFIIRACLFIITIVFVNVLPVHAYAGPGAAIGAIIVFLTVVIAFFASTFISIFNFLRKFSKKMFKTKNKKIKKNKP